MCELREDYTPLNRTRSQAAFNGAPVTRAQGLGILNFHLPSTIADTVSTLSPLLSAETEDSWQRKALTDWVISSCSTHPEFPRFTAAAGLLSVAAPTPGTQFLHNSIPDDSYRQTPHIPFEWLVDHRMTSEPQYEEPIGNHTAKKHTENEGVWHAQDFKASPLQLSTQPPASYFHENVRHWSDVRAPMVQNSLPSSLVPESNSHLAAPMGQDYGLRAGQEGASIEARPPAPQSPNAWDGEGKHKWQHSEAGATIALPADNYQCTICGKGFGRKSNLKTHEKKHDPMVAKSAIYCREDGCNTTFGRQTDLKRHRATVRSSRSHLRISADICEETSPSRQVLL